MVYTKADSLKSYSINILNTIEASEIYYFENLHIIQKQTTNELLVFRWTPTNKEIPFNSKIFSGKLEVFDQDYQLTTIKSFVNGTSDPVSNRYLMGCDVTIDCNCPGDPYCGCDGSWPNCVNSFTISCTLGGGGGGGEGGGGTGPTDGDNDTDDSPITVIPINPIVVDEVEDPCSQLANLCDPSVPSNLSSSINLLKTTVEAPDNNKENGFVIEKRVNFDAELLYVATPGVISNVDNFSIILNIGGNFIIGSMHSHPQDGVPVPSFGDLIWLRDCYLKIRVLNRPFIFSMVVCKNQITNVTNTYALKINDFDALNTMINSVWNNPKYAGYATEKEKMDAIHFDEATQYEANNNEYQRVFLQKYGTTFGIDFFDANASYNNWSKLSLSNPTAPNPTVIPTPCN